MKPRKIAALLTAALPLILMCIFALPSAGARAVAPAADIVLGRADTARSAPVGVQQGLLDAIAIPGPRAVVDRANTTRGLALPALPGALRAEVDRVTDRVVVGTSNTIRRASLSALAIELGAQLNRVTERVVADRANTILRSRIPDPPLALQAVLDEVSPRVVFDRSNTARRVALHYPAAVMGDTTAPQIGNPAVKRAGGGAAVVTWPTDELADSEVRFGEQPGQYSRVVRDPLFVTQHAVTMTLLIPGVTYHFLMGSADLSGNAAVSPEYTYTFDRESFVYLPMLVRQR